MKSPEKMKAKLKLLGEQFDKERNEKTRQLRPIVVGCIWFSQDLTEVHSKVVALLSERGAVPWSDELPIDTMGPVANEELETSEMAEGDSPPRTTTKRVFQFPTDGTTLLIRISHGARVSRKVITAEFLANWSRENPAAPLPTKSAVTRKIKELALWQECQEEPLAGKLCWLVPLEVREANGCGDLTLLNTWEFPNRRISDIQDEAQRITKFTKALTEEERRQLLAAEPEPEVTVVEEKKSPALKITKFTRVLTEEERKQQLKSISLPEPDVIVVDEKKSPALKITKFTKVLTEEERKQQLKPISLPPVVLPKPIVNSLEMTKTISKLNQFKAVPGEKKRVALLSSVPLSSPKTEATEPAKKKVAILFSAPCGVEIVKPTEKGEILQTPFVEEEKSPNEAR